RVTTTSASLDPVTRTMRTEIHLDNKAGDKAGYLKPQMSGTAKVVLAERKAMTVPSSALVRSGSRMEIYVVGDATGDPLRGVVKRMEVQLGLDDGVYTEIRSERLTGRELVIRRGAGVVRPDEEAIAVPFRAGE